MFLLNTKNIQNLQEFYILDFGDLFFQDLPKKYYPRYELFPSKTLMCVDLAMTPVYASLDDSTHLCFHFRGQTILVLISEIVTCDFDFSISVIAGMNYSSVRDKMCVYFLV